MPAAANRRDNSVTSGVPESGPFQFGNSSKPLDRLARQHRVRQITAQRRAIALAPIHHRPQRPAFFPGQRMIPAEPLQIARRRDMCDRLQRRMAEHLSHPRGGELEQRLAQRLFAVHRGRFARGRHHDRKRRHAVPLAPYAIHPGHAELVGSELRQNLNAECSQPVQQRARARIGEAAAQIEHDATVHGSKADAVAVALQQLANAVADGEIQRRPGAQPVGDRRRDRTVARRKVTHRAAGDLGRHQDALAARPALRRHPFEHGVMTNSAARLQAQRQRIGDPGAPELRGECRVAAGAAREPRNRPGRMHRFRQFPRGADDGFRVRRAIAHAVRCDAMKPRAIPIQKDSVPAGHAGAVQRRQAEQLHPARRHRLDIRRSRIGDIRGQEMLAHRRIGIGVVKGGPAITSSNNASAAFVLVLVAYSNGVNTLVKSSCS